MVNTAKREGWSWNEVQAFLTELSRQPRFGADDSVVREFVFNTSGKSIIL